MHGSQVTDHIQSGFLDSSTEAMDGFRVENTSVADLLSTAATMTAAEVERLVPGRGGYPSWLSPFRSFGLMRGLHPNDNQVALLRSAANICRWGVRLPERFLSELEMIIGRTHRKDVEALFPDDGWLQNFLLNIHDRASHATEVSTFPWNISLPIADICNARCIFCTSWIEGRAMISPSQIDNFAEVIARAVYVGLVGHGEPLAHPKFLEIGEKIAQLIDPRAVAYTITNGIHLKKWLPLLERMRLGSVSVSLNAASAPVHDEVMGLGADAFDQVVEGIVALKKMSAAPGRPGVDVSITMVVTKQNLHEIEAFVRLGEKLGVSSIWFRPLLSQSDLVEGLNYHTLSPTLHPDYDRLMANARTAIETSTIKVQADPDEWGRPVLPEGVRSRVAHFPPRFVSRTESLKNKELRRRSEALYEPQQVTRRGNRLSDDEQTHIDWLSEGARIRCANKPWSFALATPLLIDPSLGDDLRLTARALHVAGEVSVGIWGGPERGWLDRVILTDADEVEILLEIPANQPDLMLIVDNASQVGVASRIELLEPKISSSTGSMSAVDLRLGVVHNGADPLSNIDQEGARDAPFNCRSPYYNLYINEIYLRMTPCCYMTNTPGYEDIRFDGSVPFMAAWNAPSMVELRRSLRDGPLYGACRRCPERW